jgi:hypothetical protein
VERDTDQASLGAPAVAIEVLSPDDRRAEVEHKIVTDCAGGVSRRLS